MQREPRKTLLLHCTPTHLLFHISMFVLYKIIDFVYCGREVIENMIQIIMNYVQYLNSEFRHTYELITSNVESMRNLSKQNVLHR